MPISLCWQPNVAISGLMMALSGLYWKASRQQRCSKLFHCRQAMPTGCLWNALTGYRSYANTHESFNCTTTGGIAMNNLMTTKQVADFCGVSVSTVLRWNSVNRRTGQKYRPDFPDPDIKSCPNKWASHKIYRFAGVIE